MRNKQEVVKIIKDKITNTFKETKEGDYDKDYDGCLGFCVGLATGIKVVFEDTEMFMELVNFAIDTYNQYK